jgi:hypothetical protein
VHQLVVGIFIKLTHLIDCELLPRVHQGRILNKLSLQDGPEEDMVEVVGMKDLV